MRESVIRFRKAVGIGLTACLAASAQAQQAPPAVNHPPPFAMVVPGFADEAMVPVQFTCAAG